MWLCSVVRSCATQDAVNKDDVGTPTISAGINRPPHPDHLAYTLSFGYGCAVHVGVDVGAGDVEVDVVYIIFIMSANTKGTWYRTKTRYNRTTEVTCTPLDSIIEIGRYKIHPSVNNTYLVYADVNSHAHVTILQVYSQAHILPTCRIVNPSSSPTTKVVSSQF